MNFGLVGSSGRMGKEIIETFEEAGHLAVLRLDLDGEKIEGTPDVMIDFSRPEALDKTLGACERYGCPLVIGTTALGEKDMKRLKALSEKVPIVQSYNFSIGINVMLGMLEEFSSMMSDWDAEIIETHHNLKKDKPSGTAIMMKKAVKRDIPAHSLRIGGVPGDHSVVFANEGEILEISHRAISRKVFAIGALRAVNWIVGKKPGLYAFGEVIGLKGA